jgi:hypothetical protein
MMKAKLLHMRDAVEASAVYSAPNGASAGPEDASPRCRVMGLPNSNRERRSTVKQPHLMTGKTAKGKQTHWWMSMTRKGKRVGWVSACGKTTKMLHPPYDLPPTCPNCKEAW